MGPPPAVRDRRRDSLRHHSVRVPVRRCPVARRDLFLVARRGQQHLDGAVPGVHFRPLAQVAASPRVPDARACSPARAQCSRTSRCSCCSRSTRWTAAGNGVPYWMYTCFWIGTICILLDVLTAMAAPKELTPSDEDLAEIRAAAQGARVRDRGHQGRGQDDAGRDAQDRRRVPVPVVRDVHLLAVRRRQHRPNGLRRRPGQGWSGLGSGDRVERPDERRLQLRHHGFRAVPGRFLREDRCEARPRRRSGPGRALADLVGAHPQPVPRTGSDDRRRYLLGQRRSACPT